MRQTLRQYAWLSVPVLILAGDLAFRWALRAPRNVWHSPSNLLASVGLSFLLWWALSRLIGASERRWVWATLVAIPTALLCAVAWQFEMMTGHAPTSAAVVYLWQAPGSALRMTGAQLSAPFVLGVAALAGVFTAALAAWRGDLSDSLRRSCKLAIIPWFLAAFMWPAGMTVGQSPFTADFHVTHTLAHGATELVTGQASGPLQVADRVDLPDVEPPRELPNVIVFLAESLRRDRMQVFGHDRPTTPRMAKLFEARADEVYPFDRAVTASAYTQLSVPMITSGLYMARDRQTMHRAPLLWHYARAAGAQTFLISPQQWGWQGLHEFMLLDDPPDTVITAEHLPGDIVNDVGVHDDLATEAMVDVLTERLDRTRPFVGVIQTNATHFPFLTREQVPWELETAPDIYDAAVALTDEMFGAMLDALTRVGELEDTVIIFLADHGEFFYDADTDDREAIAELWQEGLRVRSCHPVVARIPMFAVIPDKWRDLADVESEALRTNRDRLVSSVDVVPTILDLWQMSELPAKAGLDGLDGQSLLEAVDAQRAAFCINSAGWNLRAGSGFAAFGAGRAVYARTDFERMHVYDTDQAQTWTQRGPGEAPGPQDEAWLEDIVDRTPIFAPYLEHVRD